MRALNPGKFDQMTREAAWYVRLIKAACDLKQLKSRSGDELKNAYLTLQQLLDFLIEQQHRSMRIFNAFMGMEQRPLRKNRAMFLINILLFSELLF